MRRNFPTKNPTAETEKKEIPEIQLSVPKCTSNLGGRREERADPSFNTVRDMYHKLFSRLFTSTVFDKPYKSTPSISSKNHIEGKMKFCEELVGLYPPISSPQSVCVAIKKSNDASSKKL